jgi:hypothetical protein
MKEKLSWFDRVMAAVTFAEANEHNAAKEYLRATGQKSERQQKCRECSSAFTDEMHGAKVR